MFAQCSNLKSIIKSLKCDEFFATTYQKISERESYLNDVHKALKHKKTIKKIRVSAIICATIATIIGVTFGIIGIANAVKKANIYQDANTFMVDGDYDDAITYFESLGNYQESQKKIKVCEGLKQLELSIETKSEDDIKKGIKTIVSAGEKVEILYKASNNASNNKQNAVILSGQQDKIDTIDNVDFTFYQPSLNGYSFTNWNSESCSYSDDLTHLSLHSN